MTRFVDALKQEIADLERLLHADPIYVKLVEARRLLSVYGDAPLATTAPVLNRADNGVDRERKGSAHYTAIEASLIALEQASRPVPTVELLKLLEPLGVTFGGKTPQNSLSSILSKSDLFKTNGRAGWTLAKPSASTETEMADDPIPTQEVSSASDVDLDLTELLGPYPAQGREAGPGGSP